MVFISLYSPTSVSSILNKPHTSCEPSASAQPAVHCNELVGPRDACGSLLAVYHQVVQSLWKTEEQVFSHYFSFWVAMLSNIFMFRALKLEVTYYYFITSIYFLTYTSYLTCYQCRSLILPTENIFWRIHNIRSLLPTTINFGIKQASREPFSQEGWKLYAAC